MRIVLEKIDGQIYGDIILSPKDVATMKLGEMVDGVTTLERRKCFFGVRLQGLWEDQDEEEQIEKEDSEGF